MTTPDFRELCEELIEELRGWIGYGDEADCADAHAVVNRARAALAAPPPELPTDREIYEWAAPRRFAGEALALTICAALEKWGQCSVQRPKPPTDEELEQLVQEYSSLTEVGDGFTYMVDDEVGFARAVLERWG